MKASGLLGGVEHVRVRLPMVRLCTLWRAHAAVFKIGTIVSYGGRLHVVVGMTPMSVTPQLVEIEDRESGRIRRVPAADLQLCKEPEESLREDDREGDV
ncbi:MAG: hypothetical protein H0W90_17020 [Actinobacteria bacterium]|nr:hypothetical protein [Actinomycetota bacterium]